MKYKHFRAIVITCALVGGAFSIRACYGWLSESPEATDATSRDPSSEARGNAQAPRGDAPRGGAGSPADPSAMREVDTRILARVAAGVSSPKLKDVFKGDRIKVNLYNEDGKIRAKVDLDRDDKWDEKWDFETKNGEQVVKRRISSADDDATYDVEYRLVGARWVKQ